MSPSDLEPRTEFLRDRVQGGLDALDEYGGPLLDRYGRVVLIAGVALVAAVGIALILSRRSARATFTRRIQDAIPDSVGERLERPMSSIRSARERIRQR